jgi:hypothetical protein
MVDTWTPPLSRVVAILVSPTVMAQALKSTGWDKSVRRKTIPASAAAGCSVRLTFFPECKATPDALIVFLIVR